MIAKIYPIQRMPRKSKSFDYLVGDNFNLDRGDMVLIPFRNSQIFGIVQRMTKGHPRGIRLKEVLKKIPEVKLSEEELAFFESTAKNLCQSVSSIFHTTLPHPPKKSVSQKPNFEESHNLTLPVSEVEHLSETLNSLKHRGSSFIAVPDLKRMCALIAGIMHQDQNEVVMILCPTVLDAKRMYSHLSSLKPEIVTGEESNSKRYFAWLNFRNKKTRLLIGTKTAAFLCRTDISTIFVLRSSNKNHKNFDRNPRYDVRQVAMSMGQIFNARTFFMDTMMRVDDLNVFDRSNIFTYPLNSPVEIIPMNKEVQLSPHPCLSATTHSRSVEILEQGKQVVFIYNKKGQSTALSCSDCNHVFFCQNCQHPLRVYEKSLKCHRCLRIEIMPLTCPLCNSYNLSTRGFGNQKLESDFSNLYRGKTIAVIDKEHSDSINLNAQILIATNYFYENVYDAFSKNNIGLVVLLEADTPLYDPSFRALEKAALQAQDYRGLAFNARASFIIQTYQSELFDDLIRDPMKLMESELEQRISYSLPPSRTAMQITYKSDEKRESEHALNSLKTEISKTAPEVIINTYKNGMLELLVSSDQKEKLLSLFSSLNDRFIIDTDALL